MSASKWYDEIVLSEYVESARDEVHRWMERDPNAFNWQQYFEHVAQLEG